MHSSHFVARRGFAPLAHLLFMLALVSACGHAQLPIRRVVLYQNGIGYFERVGDADGETLRLRFAAHEVDDALKTLTIVGAGGGATLSASVRDPRPQTEDEPRSAPEDAELVVRLAGGQTDHLLVAYAVPVPVWRVTYRLVLDDAPGGDADEPRALLQAWALVHNASAEDWRDVRLTLATQAPLSFATDLRSPHFMPRPDASGRMVQPVATGLVRSSAGRAGRDHDGVPDEDDLCPTEDEDRDGFEDADGCPDPDNDQDRILDPDDQCPNDPETYNGFEDSDGCPDRGRVVIEESSLVIMDKIYFPRLSPEIPERSGPILDAIAATLNGNPQIRRVVVQGHAASDEPNAWALSAERAASVRAALVRGGVAPARLAIESFGATRPVDPRDTQDARERNRRVEFDIRDAGQRPPEEPRLSASSVAGVEQQRVDTQRALGGTTYEIARGVFVPAHSTAVISLIDQRVEGEEVYLFRPDSGARGSATHPFRAVRFENDTGAELVPGPVALFAHGRYAGEGLLDGLAPDETAFVPYAVDSSTRVSSERSSERQPVRVISVVRGTLSLEDRELRTTRYQVRAAQDAPRRIFIRHPRSSGYSLSDLPPGSQEQPDAVLAPMPLQPGESSALSIVETRLWQRRVSLLSDLRFDLGLYLEGSALSDAGAEALRRIIALRGQLRQLDAQTTALRRQTDAAASRTAELRANLRAMDAAGQRRTPLRNRLRQ
ncbi:MAG: OmpA family protein, partial [Deltaproteobacteria bacterium]|nr:OmpA family protein [Deltaproteobacteria bacterium]